ncbi:MAG: N4-gp56 family major capsid protein [Clostridiales bacterium]|nr:N4-gp56 family major capsid protein [Clostridiales bacterium]
MSVNYASKYSSMIDERFKVGALTESAVNNDYDFIGVKTVNVYSVPTAKMNDYTRTGDNRYGTPEELENGVQEMTLSRDRSFTFTIDRGNYDDNMMANAAGMSLQRQIDEVVIPELDIYRIAKMAASAGNTGQGQITKDNAYEAFLDGTVALTNAKVPTAGRVAFVSASFYKFIKLDDAFIKASDMAQDMLIKGQVGMIDGIALILVPDNYLPTDTAFIITHSTATVAPVKLAEYKVHDNPPGINGWLVEGRVYYDAFVLSQKADAIYVHKNTVTEGA